MAKRKGSNDGVSKQDDSRPSTGTFNSGNSGTKRTLRVVQTKRVKLCAKCLRDTNAPLFDGCMMRGCPYGHKPCL